MIDINKIKTECPKAFKVFKEYLNNKYNELDKDSIVFIDDKGLYTQYDYDDPKNYICFCDIVDFFDKQGIIISIYHSIKDNSLFLYVIDYNKDNESNGMCSIKTRPEAQAEATYDAFQILEERLR